MICLNKLDLLTDEARANAAESLRPYRELGHRGALAATARVSKGARGSEPV